MQTRSLVLGMGLALALGGFLACSDAVSPPPVVLPAAPVTPAPPAPPPAAPAVTSFGHAAVDGFASLSAAQRDGVRALKIYFEHASVGGNLMDGLADLVASGGGITFGGSSNGGATDAASVKTWFLTHTGIVDNARGNPGFTSKVDIFKTSILTNTLGGSLDVAMMKFCYIDDGVNNASTDFDYYTNAMSALRTAYPGLSVVYLTMPICTGANDNRNAFNAKLRTYCADNHLWLYDIADIESHAPDGTAVLDGGKEAMCASYSADGGHLNDAGNLGRQRAARALWTTLAAIAASRP